jgi:hypothetical protein
VSARLVAAAGFKPVVGSVKRISGGFDSHPLPLVSLVAPALAMNRAAGAFIITEPNRSNIRPHNGLGVDLLAGQIIPNLKWI